MGNLTGKVGFVTGGTKGIGYGIAKAFLDQGMNVAITGRTPEGIREAIRSLNEFGNDSAYAIGVVSDVTDYDSQKAAVAQVLEEFGKVDVVIANAGLGHFAPIDKLTVAQWEQTIDTNLTGAFYTLKAALEALKKSKGYYITISSLAGTNFFASGSAYNASKFGLTGFTQSAMLDLRPYDVKVSTIMPGSVATFFNQNEPSDKDAWKIQIEDIGQIVIDLLKMHPRTLPSKIEVRPSKPPKR
ncbi:SDR family oxidoreductase [Aureisphaera galaxeae]|uniref:SDR family oxidoreductase n=1 Tax=Aureisphaera galaxeae TaxID=1538023 RepID=UPI002350A4CE|nr:SDR family oxidoreductase [Aureisphaera galaxeae]MDC8004360.1 SDR family oxidoreductase [Aureisphaera galaxeae]